MSNIFCINPKSLEIIPIKTKKEAGQYGNGLVIVEKPKDIEKSVITTAQLVKLYNSFKQTRDITKFPTKGTASQRVFEELKKSYTAHKKNTEKAKRKGSRDIPLKITTENENPFREGSWNHRTWDMIKKEPNKTFNDYIKMGGRANTIYGAIKNGWLTKCPLSE